eukprot:1460080-Pleurochrysis_carterae.AAC.1
MSAARRLEARQARGRRRRRRAAAARARSARRLHIAHPLQRRRDDVDQHERERGGVSHGRRGQQRRGREPHLSHAVGEISVNAFDTIRMVMVGGGRKFAKRLRAFTIRSAPIRKRKLPAASTFNKAAAGRAVAEITALKRQLEGVTAELQQTKASFIREMHIHVRDGFRKAPAASDVGVHEQL